MIGGVEAKCVKDLHFAEEGQLLQFGQTKSGPGTPPECNPEPCPDTNLYARLSRPPIELRLVGRKTEDENKTETSLARHPRNCLIA
jgi:hypothetical protein